MASKDPLCGNASFAVLYMFLGFYGWALIYTAVDLWLSSRNSLQSPVVFERC
jgi:hypothetical protein